MKIQTHGDNYIIQFRGHPFQVTPDYPKANQYGEQCTYEYIKAYCQAHPEDVSEYIEPEQPEPSEEEEKALRISELEEQAKLYSSYITGGIDADENQQKLTNVLLEIEELKGNLE